MIKRSLLVASAGGHLDELLLLLPRLDLPDRTWVTYPVPQAERLLHGEEVHNAYHPTTKNLPNAVRNYRLARRVLASGRFDRIVTTGAAVCVPFLLRARQLGIPCHYIESATRVTGPSLSGRLVAPLSNVTCYRQLGDWGAPRWQAGPSVYDGFRASTDTTSPSIGRVVVSLGTHDFGFDALIVAVERLLDSLPGPTPEVLWQLGATPEPEGLIGRAVDRLPPGELKEAIADADVVIGHAGVGLTLMALTAGRVPLLVPRRRARREHTDDHQVQLAHELDRRRLAVHAEVGELSRGHLERAAALRVDEVDPGPFRLADT